MSSSNNENDKGVNCHYLKFSKLRTMDRSVSSAMDEDSRAPPPPGRIDEHPNDKRGEGGGGGGGEVVEESTENSKTDPNRPTLGRTEPIISTTDITANQDQNIHTQKQGHSSIHSKATRIFNLFKYSTGYYISDVVSCRSVTECRNFIKTLQEQSRLSYKRGLLLFAIHNTHVHIVHDCSFSNKTCRCKFIQKAEIQFGLRRRGRTIRRRVLCNQLKISDLQNILTYYEEEGRETNYLRIGGAVETAVLKYTSLQNGETQGNTEEGPMDACDAMDDAELRREEYQGTPSSADDRDRNRQLVRKESSKRQTKGKVMLQLLQTHLCSPIRGITTLPVWLHHPTFQFMDDGDQLVSKVFSNWEKQLCSYSIHDFHSLYSQPNVKFYFSAGHNNFDAYYYNVEDSLDILIELLNDQFHNDEECITKFITDLFNVLERRLPKLNSFLIHSNPSAGKNFFFDCIKDYYLNIGKLQNANRYNAFAFQDAPFRRVIFWNEPNYESSKIETLKEFLGGDTTNTPVKYKGEGVIFRTPILLATNNTLSIMNNPAFSDRLVIYRWHSCPILKKYTKKPNPLCTYELFKHYGLIKD